MKTSEAVGKGHPDKVCDIISDSILDEALKQDRDSRVAIETWVKDNHVGIIGEITTHAKIDYEKIIRQKLKEIGYSKEEWGINPETCKIHKHIGEQSPEIARGVDREGAGDQGIMWGYACDETKEYLPLSYVLSNKLLEAIDKLRKQNKFLRPDMKSQITINGAKEIETIILAVQHSEEISEEELKEFLVENAVKKICGKHMTKNTRIIINGTGKFTVGGPRGDAGLTGRKIIVDTYGGVGRHGGGAFSGKDPSKVDRSAAYMARYIAKNLVASGKAKEAQVQLSYCIGIKEPMSVNILLDGKQASLELVEKVKELGLEPQQIIKRFSLKKPSGWTYESTASYGHFTKNYPWEKIGDW